MQLLQHTFHPNIETLFVGMSILTIWIISKTTTWGWLLSRTLMIFSYSKVLTQWLLIKLRFLQKFEGIFTKNCGLLWEFLNKYENRAKCFNRRECVVWPWRENDCNWSYAICLYSSKICSKPCHSIKILRVILTYRKL